MNVIPFNNRFDATDMTIEQIRQKARALNWPGIRIDAKRVVKTGKTIVYRMSRKRACEI